MRTLPGPLGPIRYTRDAWGYPTIHARDRTEGAFALGWLHAEDRLVQVVISRLVAEGRVMSLVGDKPFARRVDQSARALGLARDLDAALPDDVLELHRAYAAGLDAGAAKRGWPLALRALGLRPMRWGVREVHLVYRAMCWFGLTSTTQLAKLALAELIARGAPAGALEALLGEGAEDLDLGAFEGSAWPEDASVLGVPVLGGSNAFALSAARSSSGKPILLAEFHLEIGRQPPVLYATDLRYDDGSHLLGMTVPGVPHVVAGRSARVAWTYTFGHGDNVRVTAETRDGGEVRRGDARLPVLTWQESVPVRGRPDEVWSFSRLGDGTTLLSGRARKVPGMRWEGLSQSHQDLVALARMPDAGSVDDLIALNRKVRALSTAAVFADAAGEIAWMHTGVVPSRRAGWGPVRPSEDDASLPESSRPVRRSPDEGVVVAANEPCPGWTAFPEPDYRAARVRDLLGKRERWTAAQAAQVTTDEHDGCAARLMRVWAPRLPNLPEVRALEAWARAQDAVPSADARRYRHRFHGLHLAACRELVAHLLGRAVAHRLLDELGLLAVLQPRLDTILALEVPDVVDTPLLRRLLDRAWAASGTGAALPTLRFRHQLEQGWLPSALGFSTPPLPMPGGPVSLFQVRGVPFLGETLAGGPAFRLVMDMAEPGGRYNICGGASERRFGPGYGAGLDTWLAGLDAPIGPEGR